MNDIKDNKIQSTFKVFKDKIINKTNTTNSQNSDVSAKSDFININTQKQKNITKQIPKIKRISYGLILKSALIIIVTLIIGYAIVNSNALLKRYDYWDKTNIKNLKWSELHPVTLIKANETAQKLDENYLYIPSIGLQAPITWGVEKKDINNILSTNLAHYNASALPDDATGNIFITGRTSGPIWSSTDMKTIFTLLDKAQIDQAITIIYKNKIYSYKIVDKNFYKNKEIVIAPGEEDKSYLNLLATYPIGINWKTLKIKAILYKIESNLPLSIEDKINELPENYNDPTLNPIEVKPTSTEVPIPIDEKILDPNLLPDHFLPTI